MSDPLQEAYAEIDDLKAEVARVIERADSIEGKRALAEARVFDLSNQLSEAKQNRDAAYVVQANQRNEIARLKADIASRQSCEVDAKRYRWLRECSICRSDRSCHVVWNHYDNGTFVSESQPSKDVLDQLIDEAMPPAPLGGSDNG